MQRICASKTGIYQANSEERNGSDSSARMSYLCDGAYESEHASERSAIYS
jgi:hypothetical protein